MEKYKIKLFKHKRIFTSLLGTQIGVPSFTMPFSTITPITIGSRELNINCGRICNANDKPLDYCENYFCKWEEFLRTAEPKKAVHLFMSMH